ncbi:hypothetical protein [uncultured Fibrella sp.]|uniref:hypothetical protein n=1 Tax=uncultured Fibrella sp. TaxID=1284596 RepID=UPI0035CB7656
MEKVLHNRIGYFFIGLLVITFLGFYPTYLVKFPRFEGFTSAHHFHGFVALLWILLLIVQPFLIRAKQYSLHRQVGKLGYVIMPLVMLSLFLVARAGYYRNIRVISEADTLAGLTNGIPDLFFLGTLFSLGMIYRKNTSYHLRFLASTGLMMLGPGLGRLLVVAAALPVPVAIPIIVALTTGTGLVWLIVDIRQKRSPFPMAVFVGIGFIAFVLAANGHSAWWQSFAKWIAVHLF